MITNILFTHNNYLCSEVWFYSPTATKNKKTTLHPLPPPKKKNPKQQQNPHLVAQKSIALNLFCWLSSHDCKCPRVQTVNIPAATQGLLKTETKPCNSNTNSWPRNLHGTMELQNGLGKGTLNIINFQPPSCGQEHLQLDQVVPFHHIQAVLFTFKIQTEICK